MREAIGKHRLAVMAIFALVVAASITIPLVLQRGPDIPMYTIASVDSGQVVAEFDTAEEWEAYLRENVANATEVLQSSMSDPARMER